MPAVPCRSYQGPLSSLRFPEAWAYGALESSVGGGGSKREKQPLPSSCCLSKVDMSSRLRAPGDLLGVVP